MEDSQGHEYKGAEVTSEGFHIYGLDPYAYYSAGIACYLSDVRLQQDAWDIWNNHASVGAMKDGNIVGYKYFGFGGLDKDKMGLKAFEGTKKGNHTAFNLFLLPKTASAFKVNVYLDGPWENEVWKGKKIGEVQVPAGASRETTCFTVDVSEYVDGLKGKHAIYLVAESADKGELCDLIGLGFSSDKHKLVRPVVPVVKIQVNGKAVELPSEPVRSTNANGLTGYGLYETVCKLSAGNAAVPVVSASADQPEVKITVEQAQSVSGEAVVRCDYKGLVKTYKIRFEQ